MANAIANAETNPEDEDDDSKAAEDGKAAEEEQAAEDEQAAEEAIVVKDDAEYTNCYGLALAGYGSRAAWQAGAIKGLADALKGLKEKDDPMDKHKDELHHYNWDVVGSVGSGAMNAAILSMYNVNETPAAVL